MFSLTFPVLCKFTFPIFWELYGFLLHPKYLRNLLLWNVCVFPYFSLTMGIHFFHISGIVWISASLKIVEKAITLECLFFFPYFSRIMEIHFSQVRGIVWISTSSEIFKKSINLKFLCFSIPFPHNGNPLFPCFGNCMGFCIKRKISETLNFEMFVFCHNFSLLWEFTFPIFSELYGFLLHPEYLRNFRMFVFFSILFPNSLFSYSGSCMY